MKNLYLKTGVVLFTAMVFFACNDDKDSKKNATKKEVMVTYADIAYANYKKAYDDAVLLKTAIKNFTDNPSQKTFDNAKQVWRDSRESYGTTEAYRFVGGPINSPLKGSTTVDDVEVLINSWPLDENYIDYVSSDGSPTGSIVNGGIINDIADYPVITKDLLVTLNNKIDEKSISTGYHAIEFLLWGQDLTPPSANLPGQRPYTDYVVGTGGTHLNRQRRVDYINICADLLTDNLDQVVQQWKPDGGTYRTKFLAMPEDDAIGIMYTGMTTLALSELSGERMMTPVKNANQEDEHSCFSDNTHRDMVLNLQGIIDIYEGTYGSINEPSLADLVKKADTATYNETEAALQASMDKIKAIQIPFDMAISGGVNSVEGAKVVVAVKQLKVFGADLIVGAGKIGITVSKVDTGDDNNG